MGKSGLFGLFLVIFFLQACAMPERVSQLYVPFNSDKKGDSVYINVKNTSHSPLRIYIHENYKDNRETHKFILEAKTDKSYPFKYADSIDYGTNWLLGNPDLPIVQKDLELPFPKGKTYKIIQGFNGKFSHSDDNYSRYAIDFDLKIGDTICAAADGFVVGVVNTFSKGRNDRKLRDFSNFLTIYHPEMNLYSQYVHFKKERNLVNLGDEVRAGQAIAISGNVGFTSGPHLHFNVLKSVEQGLESIPYDFINYKGIELTRATQVTNK